MKKTLEATVQRIMKKTAFLFFPSCCVIGGGGVMVSVGTVSGTVTGCLVIRCLLQCSFSS
jgi:ABC-type xylose transport system permease subunit